MIVVYGRRRVGKTTLMKVVFKDAIYFFVDTRSSETLLRDFSRQVIGASFERWKDFFRYVLESEMRSSLTSFRISKK